MKFPNKYETWKISLLTPLHIGNGSTLEAEVDFTGRNGRLEVIDSEATFRQLLDNPAALRELGREKFSWNSLVRQYKIKLVTSYTLDCRGSNRPQRIRSFIKDGFSRPYLPGSSLKGSLRTAFLVKLAASSTMKPILGDNSKRADDRYLDKLAGGNPHNDFLRGFHVSDSLGADISECGIMAREIKFFNLQTPTQAGWKHFSGRRTIDDYSKADGIHVETLEPGINLTASFSMEGFLSDTQQRKNAGLPTFEQLQDLDGLYELVNNHALKTAQSELNFFRQYKTSGKAAAEFYEKLCKKIKEMSPGNGFICRIAWGSGWKGMTGDWMCEDLAQEARKKFRLGKTGMPYPKTRRLALDEHGVPCLPLGWIMVMREPGRVFHRLGSGLAVDTTSVPENIELRHSPVAAGLEQQTPPRSPEEIRAEVLQEFRAVVEKSGPGLSGQIDDFINRINEQNDERLKKEMAILLHNAARSLGKSYKNAAKKNKPWVMRLSKLCSELGVE